MNAAKAKKSPEQTTALQKLLEDPHHRIRRLPGGFWTTPSTHAAALTPGRFDKGALIPTWYIGTQTIRAMEKRGWLRRVNVHAEEWRDERELTEAGHKAAEA
jgi:hypothetical protein